MKFIKQDLGANKHIRYCYALGKAEAEILFGALLNAQQWTPKTFGTTILRSRLNDMIRVIRKTLPELEDNSMKEVKFVDRLSLKIDPQASQPH